MAERYVRDVIKKLVISQNEYINMKKIINQSNKKLVFPKFDLTIDSNEIKELDDNLVSELLGNANIKEVISKPAEKSAVKEVKGRRRKLSTNKINN